jgi:hypothetical protein
MQQRRLRPGDILDDYCPRERRLTDHAVVAMVENEVKQVRCTACDAEHEYKRGKMPTLRRKKDSVSAAYQEVLASVTSDPAIAQAVGALRDEPLEAVVQADPPAGSAGAISPAPVQASPVPAPKAAPVVTHPGDAGAGQPRDAGSDGFRVHRRLIRATLPRPENQPVVRPIPEFTMHQPQGRPGKFRGGMGRGMGARGGHGGSGGSGGYGNQARGPAFGRPGGNRAPGGRNEGARHGRGHHPGRPGKKHSK